MEIKKTHENRLDDLEKWQDRVNLKLNAIIGIMLFIATSIGTLIFFIIRLFVEGVLKA